MEDRGIAQPPVLCRRYSIFLQLITNPSPRESCILHFVSYHVSTSADRNSGIPYTIKNQSAQPWLYRTTAPITHSALAEEDSLCTSSSNSSGYWYEQIDHNGQSSFMDSRYKDNYTVFRNVVKDFGADNTGQKDAAAAISAAIKGMVESINHSKHFLRPNIT